jgi:cyclohexanone monooxygenase
MKRADNAGGIDLPALRQKYRQERDRRLRLEGIKQYVGTPGRFSYYEDNPYEGAPLQRASVSAEVQVLIIGAGFGGLLAGVHLREAGIDDVWIVDKAGDFGGTWYWNRYPGVACDIESLTYLPLLEETGYRPPRKYSTGAEIFQYCKLIADKFDLYRNALFQTGVSEVRWDERAGRWIVTTDRDDRISAQFVIFTAGPFMKPKFPRVPGIDTLTMHTFHSSRWDYGYTGGGPDGGLDGLRDKRVGIIGTGATAVQIVPHLAESAKQVFVFQRTPSAVMPKLDRAIDDAWYERQEPGWHRRRVANFTAVITGQPVDVDIVNDGWTSLFRNLQGQLGVAAQGDAFQDEELELADAIHMQEVRKHVADVVGDPATAEALKPWYRTWCKRPCFSDTYLESFNRSNVTLVDTDGQGITSFDGSVARVDEREIELDCLIFATGYDVFSSLKDRTGFEIYGRDGLSLSQHWSKGMRTYHGYLMHGFPNLFKVANGAQTGLSANFTHTLDRNAAHVASVVQRALARSARIIEVSREAEDAWVQEIIGLSDPDVSFKRECTPGYYNGEGMAGAAGQNAPYGKGPTAFFDRMAEWRAGTAFTDELIIAT